MILSYDQDLLHIAHTPRAWAGPRAPDTQRVTVVLQTVPPTCTQPARNLHATPARNSHATWKAPLPATCDPSPRKRPSSRRRRADRPERACGPLTSQQSRLTNARPSCRWGRSRRAQDVNFSTLAHTRQSGLQSLHMQLEFSFKCGGSSAEDPHHTMIHTRAFTIRQGCLSPGSLLARRTDRLSETLPCPSQAPQL